MTTGPTGYPSGYPSGTPGGYPAGPPQPVEVRIGAIGEAWTYVSAQLGTWIGAAGIYLVTFGVLYFLQNLMLSNRNYLLFGMWALLNVLVSSLLMAGMYRMAIKQIRGEDISIGDVFSTTDVFWGFFLASFLYGLLAGIASLFCFFPGLIVSGLLMLSLPLVVDRNLGAVDALSQSWNALRTQWLNATLFIVIVSLIGVAGLLVCCVGLLLSVPLAIMSIAVVYRDFFLTNIDTAQSSPLYPPIPNVPPMQ